MVALVGAAVGASGLTGFYATRAAFAARHGPPLGDPPGAAYGPRLPHGGTHIAQVSYSGGRVTGFTLQYDPSVPFEQAHREVLSALPDDARLVFDTRKNACEMVEYDSAQIAKLIGPVRETPAKKKIDKLLGRRLPGLILVAYYSGQGGTAYRPNAVTSVVFAPGYNLQDKNSSC